MIDVLGSAQTSHEVRRDFLTSGELPFESDRGRIKDLMADQFHCDLGNGEARLLDNSEAQQDDSAVPRGSEFKRKLVRGGAANALGQGATVVLQIGSTIVLARLLSPTDYGLQAMVFTVIAFFNVFRDAGLNAAAIQRQNLNKEEISSLFWINLVFGAFLTLTVAAAAPALAAFYREPRLVWITIASATIFLFSSLGVQHRALLDRTMQFTAGAKIDLLSFALSTAIAIVMATLGCGYWSLIVQNIGLPLIATAAAWMAMPWLPGRPRWSPELRAMLRFGGTVSLNGLVIYIGYNTEKILLGRFWGAAPLGIYGRASQLANLPVQQVTSSFGSVAFPMLSRLQGQPERLRRSYLKSHSLVVSLTVPAVIASALFAKEIIRVMLGTQWTSAVPVLRLLSPMALVFALMNPLDSLVRATGRVQRSLKIALLIMPVVLVGVIAGLRHGPSGIAIGYSTAMVLLFGPAVAWAKHGTGITARDYLDCIKRPLIASALGGAAGWFAHLAFADVLGPIPLLALELTLFLAVYVALMIFAMGQRDFYVDIARQFTGRTEDSTIEV